MRANERIHAIDDQYIEIERLDPHVYTLSIELNSLSIMTTLATDDCANLADALLVISEADRAERMAERKQQKGK